ncbi:E3 UBIQUITIN-PROTEIN LIGASE RNF8-LIKE [Salix purpurea]|uniref:E3 UBIQUITIN-PROTEIN LIGASE RNF8-LIKE n=1 Tax=Salix purpurea TaxID=77065 RepID=A0A9Q1AFS6_SALPP|nr:E3 UBIQUITIN-PROTEIN LIGASE RNF8-LIKE [Salix purpurea]
MVGASDFSRDYDGACLQMRMSYAPAASLFLFLFQWTDCHLAGALGLLRILIYKVYVDGTTTMLTHERKASIKEFYAVIYPSLLQLQRGVTDTEDKKQKAVCMESLLLSEAGQVLVSTTWYMLLLGCLPLIANGKIRCSCSWQLTLARSLASYPGLQLGCDFKGNAIITVVHCTGGHRISSLK